jgi:hypothetical protein
VADPLPLVFDGTNAPAGLMAKTQILPSGGTPLALQSFRQIHQLLV